MDIQILKDHIQRLLDRTHTHRIADQSIQYLVGKTAGLMVALGALGE
ncbi:MAG: hypothetical protein WA151_00660 [Desulfatirhabdiaceae bacterium]